MILNDGDRVNKLVLWRCRFYVRQVVKRQDEIRNKIIRENWEISHCKKDGRVSIFMILACFKIFGSSNKRVDQMEDSAIARVRIKLLRIPHRM